MHHLWKATSVTSWSSASLSPLSGSRDLAGTSVVRRNWPGLPSTGTSDGVAHVVVEAVGRLGSNRADAIDNQLLEVPFAGGRFGDLRLPDSVFRGLETGDDSSTRDDGRRSRRAFVADRTRLRAAVLRCEHKRLGNRIDTVGHDHADGFVQRACRFPLADDVAGSGERGDRAVGPVGVGLTGLPGPGVVSGRGDVDRSRQACCCVGRYGKISLWNHRHH